MLQTYTLPLKWLLGLLVQLVLLHAALELRAMQDNIPVLSGLTALNTSRSRPPPADRVVVFLVSGLRGDVYMDHENRSAAWRELRGLGVVGASRGSFAERPDLRLAEMLSGVKGLRPRGPLPEESVFSHTSALYVGPPSLAPQGQESRCYPSSWENKTIFPFPNEIDDWILNQTIEALPVIKNKNFILVYFPGMESTCFLEGRIGNETLEELQFILKGINNVYLALEEQYPKDKTAYILTSDYLYPSAVDWNEKLFVDVPFVAWGSGFSERTNTNNNTEIERKMECFDIASLISTLLGVPIPSHSLGLVPLFCLQNDELRAELTFENAKHLSNLYAQYEEKLGHPWSKYFTPWTSYNIRIESQNVENSLNGLNFQSALKSAIVMSNYSLLGIAHYSHFDAKHILLCVFFSLVGWIGVTAGWVFSKIKLTPLIELELNPEVVSPPSPPQPSTPLSWLKALAFDVCYGIFAIILSLILILSGFPFSTIPSSLLLLAIIWMVIKNVSGCISRIKLQQNIRYRSTKGKIFMHLIYLIITTFAIPFPIAHHIALIWAFIFSSLSDLRRKLKPYLNSWILSALPLIFICYFKENNSNYPLPFIIGAIIWIALSFTLALQLKPDLTDWIFVMLCHLLIVLGVLKTQFDFISKKCILLSWVSVPLLMTIPVIGASKIPLRLLEITLGIAVHVFHFSESFEGIAFLIISVHIFCWLLLEGYNECDEFCESKVSKSSPSEVLVWSDFRTTIYYVAYEILAFVAFGNSYDIKNWGEEPVPIFSPIISIFLPVIIKSFAVMILVNVGETLIRRSMCSNHLELKLLLMSCVSLAHFIIAPRYPTNIFLQLLFTCCLLVEPISIVLLSESVLFKIRNSRVKTLIIGNVRKMKEKEQEVMSSTTV